MVSNEIVAKPRELETEQNLMKDLFSRALRTSQTGGDGVKLVSSRTTHAGDAQLQGHTEYIFKMEAYLSTLDPRGTG